MTKFLIIGGSGLLGCSLVLAARGRGHDVIATYKDHPIRFLGVPSMRFDAMNGEEVGRIFSDINSDWIINCAALTDVDRCETDISLATRMNSELPGILAHESRRRGAGIVHISTDYVFDGKVGQYTEKSEPSPINVYGRTKLAGEKYVESENPKNLIIRTTMFGWNVQDKKSLAEWMLWSLRCDRKFLGYSDKYFSPLLTWDLSHLILDLIFARQTGLFNLSSRDYVSKEIFARKLASIYGLDQNLISPYSEKDRVIDGIDTRAVRPNNSSLCSKKAENVLNRIMPSVNEGLKKLKLIESIDLMGSGLER